MASNALIYPRATSLQLQNADHSAGKSRFSEPTPLADCAPSLGRAFADVPARMGVFPSPRFRVFVEGRERELEAGVSEQVYRIGREAIINAHRHSGAKEIEVAIEFRRSGLRVCVRDNGRGMEAGDLQRARPGRWGLLGMREAAEQIGAQLRLLSRAACGTEVELCVPGSVAFGQPAAPRVC